MTDASPETPRRRRLALAGLAAGLVAASLGLVGWSLTADDGRPSTAPEPTTTVAAAAPTTLPGLPAAEPVGPVPGTGPLPVPEDSPADARAPTPEVVHGTLSLPTIGVTQPFGEGVTLTAIDRGPSHWPGTAMPGELGNVVVAGHRVTHTRPFYDLDLLQVGDPLVFTMNDGTVWTYVLTDTSVVGPDGMHIVDQTPEHTATLFACHPKGSAAQRIVAHFRLAPAPA
jgi:sortase A